MVKTGCEGIDNILFLSDDVDEIKRKRVEKIDGMYDGMYRKFYTKEKFSNFFCVQKWDGKGFKCCCPDVGVPPSESMLW